MAKAAIEVDGAFSLPYGPAWFASAVYDDALFQHVQPLPKSGVPSSHNGIARRILTSGAMAKRGVRPENIIMNDE